MELPDLSLLTLAFRLRAEKTSELPPFLGSTLRGAFGQALKQVSCFAPHGGDCWFGDDCIYRYVFESPNFANVARDAMHPKLRGQKQFPPPFVLIAPGLKKKQNPKIRADSPGRANLNDDYCPSLIESGETIEFSIVLIGRAVHFRAHILVAARLLAENGLGKSGAAFKLEQAVAQHPSERQLRLYSRDSSGDVSISDVAAFKLSDFVRRRVRALEAARQKISENIIRISFVSPTSTRVLLGGKNDTTLRFGDLLKKITERLEFLAFLYGEPPQRIDYRPLLSNTDSIRTVEHNLRRYCYEQYSSRQKRTISRDVFLGDVAFESIGIQKFLHYIAAAELLNIGSNASAGLGKFVIR